MGLLDKMFKKEEKKPSKQQTKTSEFKPVVVKTDRVSHAIQEVAKKSGLSAQSLDFDLIETQTYIKMDEKDEWTIVEPGDWEKFNTTEILLNPHFFVKQEYEIKIRRYREEPWSKDLLLQIGANKEKTRIMATLRAGSVLYATEGLLEKLEETIRKKMVRAGMLIGLWEEAYAQALDPLVAKAVVEGRWPIDEDFSFAVARCHSAVPSVDDQLILWYKQKEQNQEGDRVDFSKRGFIQAVEEGEVVIEYIKPKKGRPGRTCQGEYMPVDEPKEQNRPDFRVSDQIEVVEEEERILYKAKRGGYVVFEEGVYDIRDEMALDEVSFKTTGSIDAGVETDVKLHVQEKDWMKDAIGTGLEVEATDVKVEGNVGASATVRAETVEIGGQTHQTSKIFADRAVVNVHRGHLKVKEEAKITRLEGGAVEAKRAEITQMIGGEVRAMEIRVELLGANARLYAVSGIEIVTMKGENNRLVIDAAQIEAYHDEILSLEKRIEELDKEIEKLDEKLRDRVALYEKSEPAIHALKQKIIEEKKRGIQPKPAFVIKIRQFQKLIEQIEELKSERSALDASRQEIKSRLLGFQEMVMKATIKNRGAWTDYTTIEYHLLQPVMTLEFRPKAGAVGEEVYLQKIDDEGYVVAVRKIEEEA